MRRALLTTGVMVAVLGLVTGCSSSDQGTAQGIEVQPTPASQPPADVTTINGEVPPGEPTKIDASVTLLDVTDEGLQHVVYEDTRAPGTRSPIHVHPYGGTTCVTGGQMTLYLEGAEPQVANEGECYWMPPGRPMTGVSSGDSFAVMLDTFTVPTGEPVWYVVEPGLADTADEFGGVVPHM